MQLALSLRLWLYLSAAVLWVTGAAWLLVRYLPAARSYPNGVAAISMRIHGAAAMLILVVAGMAVALHVPGAWREHKNRASGIVMGIALIALVSTGYCLYYAGGESVRALSSFGHWMPGLALPVVVVWHALAARKARKL
jgi:hypothetical protein